MKSVVIKTFPDKSFPTAEGGFSYPTLSQMHEVQFSSRQKYPIIGINQNVGSTSFYDRKLADKQQFSFGVPHYFFRFNLTSAVYEKPYAHVSWIQFTAIQFHRTTFKGHITGDAFYNGPREQSPFNPFVLLDDVIPSRFAMMFEKPNPVGFAVSFVSLDPERMGETTNDGLFIDLGNNELSNDLRVPEHNISDDMRRFLTCKNL